MDINSFVVGFTKGKQKRPGYFEAEENDAGGMTYSFSAKNIEWEVLSALIDGSITHIESDCESVRKSAFYGYTQLTSVDFPNVTLIDNQAFQYCSNLASVNIPKVTVLRDYAFGDCSALTNADFPKLTTIGNYAFRYCIKLASINLPNVISVGKEAFASCNALTNADFPKLTTADENAFQRCNELVSINLPNATIISKGMFYQCPKLTSVNLPKATSIGQYVFQNCTALTSIDLPNVISIDAGAFWVCVVLTAIILRSESLCTLKNANVFNNCYHILGTVNSTYNPNGDKDCYIYVPSTLVESYKNATNWSTYASQFRALEDYTVDGTIMGELDPNKI